jgi:DNA polymerase-3 subunit beta
MKLTVTQADLSAALSLVNRAVASRPTHPVLANVLLTADAATGKLNLTGFDLNLGIQTSIIAAVETSGAITLPARLLGEIVSRLAADSPITLSADDDDEQVKLTSKSGSYTVRSMPADDFPDLPTAPATSPVVLNAEALISGLRATLFASSNDESKQLLTGVHLKLDGDTLECAATDGHRLAVLQLQQSSVADVAFDLTIPARSLRELERMLTGSNHESLSLYADKGQVVVSYGSQILTSRSLDGTYPNYRQLIPASFSRAIQLDRRNLIAALERVAVLADQHNNVVKLSTDATGQLVIAADVQDVGSGSEALAAEINGKPIQIAFNVRYLLDGLKAMADPEIVLNCNEPSTPVVLRGENSEAFTYLVMPVQVRATA